jgi:photosystem II stability/assembly factor-like uncharacterized protein
MRLPKSSLRRGALLFFCGLVIWVSVTSAQEKSGTPERSAVAVAKKSPDTKKHALPEEPADTGKQSTVEGKQKDGDSPELIRKRDEWFYKQRSSANGYIPAGARFKAFQHMQRMMEAEGKLVRRPDGSYAAASPQAAVTPLGAVTSSWTSIGPTPTTGGYSSPVTGRVTTIAVDPSDFTGNTVLIGGAQGGIWRSTDAGATWTAVGDQNPSLSMGWIAFAPSNPSIVYAGTGESAAVGFDIYYGAGVLKSTDSGQTWTQTCTVASPTCPFIGPYGDVTPFGFFTLGGTRISYLAVNPSNPQMVLVGAQTQFAQGITEGVYCSDNGGSAWSKILPDQMSTFVGFASSTIAYAGLGNPFGSSPNAPNGNGIFKATSIGATCSTVNFTRLTSTNLPLQSSIGRIDLGIAPSDTTGNTVYASIADASTASETNLGVFVTTNGGTSWTQTSAPDICKYQCWFDNVIKVDPNNKNIAYFGGSSRVDTTGNPNWVIRTADGGNSWSTVIPNARGPGLPHVDNHAIAFFKATTGTFSGKVRMYLGNDGGVWRTDDAEAATVSWTNLNDSTLTLTQFYPSISINPSSPTIAFGGTQDNGSQNYAGSPNWTDIDVCGDGTGTAIDNLIPSSVYVACNGLFLFSSYQNGAVGTFSQAVSGINPADFSNFVPPLTADPNAADTVYVGTTKVYQSVDAANTWTPVSNDLVAGANFQFLTSIAVAPGAPQVVYTGATTGQIFVATNVSAGNFANFNQVGGSVIPPRAVTAIAVDPADKAGSTAYVAYSGFSFVNTSFGVNDPTGHIFKTTNGGATWMDVSCSVVSPANCATPVATDLPNIPVNDVVVDPHLPGTIYAATDLGVFVGTCTPTSCSWSTLSTGLPRVAVLSLRLHEASRTLRAATHGRGAWDINLNNFSFTGPHISSISPTSVNTNGAQFILTVNGSSLTGGTIQFGNTALAPTGAQSDTSLSGTVSTSLLTVGTVQIAVKTSSATSNSLPFAVMALTPTLSSLNPPSTPVQTPTPATNVAIQLTGTGFSNGAKVLFNGAQNGIITKFNSSTSLTATLPAGLLGPFGGTNDISVLNTPPGGGKSQPVTFKVDAPSPLNDNFANAINITTYTFNDVKDSSAATTESTDPTPPCGHQFTSAQGNTGGHPNGVYNTIWYNFTPIVSANLNVDTIQSYYDTVLSIWTGPAGSLVNVACNDDWNPGVTGTSQLLNVPLTAGTTYYIMVSSFGPPDPNPVALGGGTFFHFSFNGGLTPAPTITSIAPTSANSGDATFTLTVNGSGFLTGAIIDFNNSTTGFGNALVTAYVNPTQLTGTVPASAILLPGPFTINVLNPLPTIGPSNYVNFTVNVGTYPVPTLGSINPASAIAGSLPISIIAPCANCASGAVLNFNGVAKPTVVSNSFSSPYQQNVSATIATADISTPGTVQVTVSNPAPGGGPSAPQSFTITQPTVVPTIASVSPASIPANSPTTVTVTGTGLIQGAAVYISGGVGYWGANVTSPTQLSLSNLSVPTVGTYQLYVVDPAPAGTSTAFNFTVTQPPAPTITSISPTTAPNGSSPTLTITGTGFQPGASVLFNSSNYAATFSISTQLSVVIPLTGIAAGTYPISVLDPAPAGPSNTVNFTVIGPPPDFSLNYAGATSATVAAGQTATFINAVYVSALNGFTGTANLSCSLPAAATQCSASPSSAPPQQAATITVTTTARGFLPPVWPRMRFISRPQFLPVLLLMMLLGALLLRFARTRRQRFAGALPLAFIVLLLTMEAIGCGGGNSTPLPLIGTPAGTYTVTVTANSGSLTHTTTLTLVVQ